MTLCGEGLRRAIVDLHSPWGRHRRSSPVRPWTAMTHPPDPAERSAVDLWVATPPEGSLRRVTAAEDRHPHGTGSFADGRPGGGRKTPQGTSPGSRSPSASCGSVPTAASTCPPGWRGERSSGQRSAVQTFERLNVRTFQRSTPPAGRVGSGGRRANQRTAVLRSLIRNLPIRNPNILFPLFPHFPNRTPSAQLNTRAR